MPLSTRLPRKPEARTEKVEDLVERVRRGEVRVPEFQRGLRWDANNVVELFDSIYRGFPIGSLLFYRRKARAQRLRVGPLAVDAPETPEAWLVVDGQQRITALTAGLAHPLPLPARPASGNPYVLYFDAEHQRFEPPQPSGRVPSLWVPLPYLLDATQLSEWVFAWEHGRDDRLRRLVFEAGTRIREYSIPLYLIGTEDTEVAKEVFYRVNQAGAPLRWPEVHDALFGDEGSSPSTLEELARDLEDVGMGRVEEDRLLTCLLAFRGLDPTRTLAEHRHRDPEVLRDAASEALPVLRRVLSFLRKDAGIPHLKLLPKSILLDILTRFFACHEEPRPRTRILLSRWLWRTILGAGAFDDRTLRRRGIQAAGKQEEPSVQELLTLVRKERPRPLELPASFDARADDSRIVLLALSHLGPCDLQSGQPIDVATLLEKDGKGAFVKIFKQKDLPSSRGPANRIIQAKGTRVQQLLHRRISEHGPDDPDLASHAISPETAALLAAGDLEGFLESRTEVLTEQVRRYGERMAAWDHSDRPSLEHLLAEAGSAP